MGGTGYERAGRLVFALALINLAVLALGFGGQLLAGRGQGVPEFNAEKIHVRTQPELKRARPRLAEEAPPAAEPVELRLCLAMQGIDQRRYEEVKGALAAQSVLDAQCQYRFDRKLPWWVFWPPEYEAAQRDKVLQSLRLAGVKDVMPISKGPLAQAFSLAVFELEGQALAHRDKLRGKGVEKAEFGPRPGEDPVHLLCETKGVEQKEKLAKGLPNGLREVELAACLPPPEAKAGGEKAP